MGHVPHQTPYRVGPFFYLFPKSGCCWWLNCASGSLGLMRIFNDIAVMTALSYSKNKNIVTGLILQADVNEVQTITEQLIHHLPVFSHRLLLRTMITEISLWTTTEHMWKIKSDITDIEHNTKQHPWHSYHVSDEEPKSDTELSRLTHGFRIRIAIANRWVECATIYTELLLENLKSDVPLGPGGLKMQEWLHNLKTQARMAKLDNEFLTKRADNQVGAVSVLSSVLTKWKSNLYTIFLPSIS